MAASTPQPHSPMADPYASGGHTDSTKADKRSGQALRNLLCAARPYVCIGWLWAWGSAICFYYAALGYMFVLVGCRHGAGPYVSIVCVYVYMCICMCVYICVCMCVCMCVCVCVCVCMFVCVFIGLPHHSEGTCWRYRSSSN